MKNKNGILITIDCLRADHVGYMGYERSTTPNLDDLAENGFLFKQAIAQGDKTATSVPALLTSTYPLMFDGYKKISKPRKMISEVLKEKGYATAAIHSNPHLSKYYHYDRGFDYFEDFLVSRIHEESDEASAKKMGSKIKDQIKDLAKELHEKSRLFQKIRRTKFGNFLEKMMGWENVPEAQKINSKALEWIKKQREDNFFLWMHYMDMHMPLKPPLSFLKEFSPSLERLDSTGLKKKIEGGRLPPEEFKNWMDLYDAAIRYVDSAIGKILDRLKELGLWDETLVIVTADHGEEHLDHGRTGHISGTLYEEMIHVPLIVRDSELDYNEIETPVELMDVAPTILDLLDMKTPKEFVGRSLISINREKVSGEKFVFSEYAESMEEGKIRPPKDKKTACRGKDWKLIYDWEEGKHELYNLSQDPSESNNLYNENEKKSKEFEERIRNHIRWEEKKSSEIKTAYEKKIIKQKIRNKNF